MQRRSFLRLLATTACAVAAGVEFILPEIVRPQLINGIHPDWLFARYSEAFLFSSEQIWHDRCRNAWLELAT